MTPTASSTAERVAALMPQLKVELAQLVAIPSVSAPGFPEETRPALLEAYEAILDALPRRRRPESRRARAAQHRPGDHRRDPCAGRAPTVLLYGHYDVVAAGRRVEVGVAAVRGDRARRRDLRARRGRLQVEHPRPRRRAARVGGQAARRGQDPDRGSGGGRAASLETPVEARAGSRADAILVADGGNIRPGVPSLDRRRSAATRPVTVEVRTLGERQALRAVRRRCARRADRPPPRARLAARRERRRRRRRPPPRRRGQGASWTDDEFRQLAEMEPGMPVPRHWPARRIESGHRPRDHGHRHRRAVGRRRGERRLAVRARASSTSASIPSRTPAEAQAAVIRHLEEVAAVRDPAHGHRGRYRQRLPRHDRRAPPTRRMIGALRDGLGQRARS